jgi:phosphohistidine phosphatase SixA
MKLYLMRHSDAGELVHAPGVKDPDPGLTAEGREIAMAMAKHMKESGAVPTKVFASKLARSRQTAQIVAKEFGLPAPSVESGVGPMDHRGPTLGVVLKKLAADKSNKRIAIVSHHDNIRQGLAVLNFLSDDDVDPIAKAEVRILDVKRKDGTWDEDKRCLPSDIGMDDLY